MHQFVSRRDRKDGESLGSDPTTYHYNSIMAYLQEDADVGVTIGYHEFFMQLGDSFVTRVAKFMRYDKIYRKRYSIEGFA
jgi:hypothetical protein